MPPAIFETGGLSGVEILRFHNAGGVEILSARFFESVYVYTYVRYVHII